MRSPTLVLLSSPLLGAVAWQPVADMLRDQGARAVIVEALDPQTPEQVLEAFTAGLPSDDEVILVPHSNAGLFAPSVAVAGGPRTLATVFVDAALPAPAGSTPLAPPDFYDFLAGLADQGRLPPWTEWWGAAGRGLFPSGEWQRRVEAKQPRLPLSYFRGTVGAPAGWTQTPCAYLAFGDTYADEIQQARSHGWPIRVLNGGHLHMLHDPQAVAHTILELRSELRGTPSR
jgi:hypothetical protein